MPATRLNTFNGDGSVRTNQIADSSITTAKIVDEAVSSAKIASLSPSPAGTYGSVSAIPVLTVNSKGQVSSVTTAAISTTPADGSITYAKLSDSATESENVAKRTAKAWVNFNGTGTIAIRNDFNVSSITDTGAGDYTVNLTSAVSDANGAAVIEASLGTPVGDMVDYKEALITSSSTIKIATFNGSAWTDASHVYLVLFR